MNDSPNVKPAGRVDESGDLHDAIEGVRARFGHTPQSSRPLPTGSLYLDLLTGVGGLPRALNTLWGPSSDSLALVRSIIATTQRHGGLVAVVDLADHFTRSTKSVDTYEFDELLIARYDDVPRSVDAADELLRSGQFDLIVINDPEARFALWSADKAGHRVGAGGSLADLERAARTSHTAMVLSTSESGGSNIFGDLEIELKRLSDTTMETAVRAAGAGTLAGVLHIEESGRINIHNDLLDASALSNVVQGRMFRADVSEDPLLERRLAEAVEAVANSMREHADVSMKHGAAHEMGHLVGVGWPPKSGASKSATSVSTTASITEPSSWGEGKEAAAPDDDPHGEAHPLARFLNAWFEGNEPVLPLHVDAASTLKLAVEPRRIDQNGASAKFNEPDNAENKHIQLQVSIYGRKDFSVTPRSRTLILPPRPAASEPVEFEVTPLREGDLQLRVVVRTLRELEFLQDLTIEAAATAAYAPVGAV